MYMYICIFIPAIYCHWLFIYLFVLFIMATVVQIPH